jgi:hypothetical protein
MEQAIEVVKVAIEKGPEIISAIAALLSGVIAISLLIPGEQPEKALKAVVEFLAKFSKK